MRARDLGAKTALCVSLAGCSEPSAHVLAVWVEQGVSAEALPSVQVYDRGQRFELVVEPVVPGSKLDLLQVSLDQRGDGLAIRGAKQETTYQSFRTLQTPRITSATVGERKLDREFAFARNGDAIFQGFEGAGSSQIGFLPISQPRSGATLLSVPDPEPDSSSWQLLTASAGPVLYWLQQNTNPTRTDGKVYAVGYPSLHNGELPGLTEPTLLGQGELRGRGVDTVAFASRIRGWCPGHTCAAPQGTSLTAMGPGPCTLLRWSWTQALAPFDDVPAESIVLPESCSTDDDPHLWAQLADDLVALDDDDRVYLYDITAGVLSSAPKIGNLTGIGVVDEGRAFVLVSGRGQVVRIDATGPRIVNAQTSACALPNPDTTVSPLGHWVIQTCAGDGAFLPTDQGQVYRISALGLETFSGITMRPLAIDDEGNALLFSYDPGDSDGAPRGLFVLTGDGRLSRVDDLEPSPAPVSSATLDSIWFSARAIPQP